MSMLFSKLPLPPSKFENNNNTICKPWQLPTVFENSLTLDEIASGTYSYFKK